MEKEELLRLLKKCADSNDTEKAHVEADELLIKYINDKDIEDAFNDIHKWYS